MLELLRRAVAEGRVEADLVVDLLDKFLDMLPQLGEAPITAGIDLFPLERLVENLPLAVFPGSGRPAPAHGGPPRFPPPNGFFFGLFGAPTGGMCQTKLGL